MGCGVRMTGHVQGVGIEYERAARIGRKNFFKGLFAEGTRTCAHAVCERIRKEGFAVVNVYDARGVLGCRRGAENLVGRPCGGDLRRIHP